VVLACLAFASAAPVSAPGQTATVPSATILVIEVFDAGGEPMRGGAVAICPADEDCREFRIGPEGRVRVDAELLLVTNELTIVVYGVEGDARLAASGWTLAATDRWLIRNRPERALGRLVGTDGMGLDLTFAAYAGPTAPPTDHALPSSWTFGGGAVWIFGKHFADDETALMAGVEVEPGLAVMLGRRLGVPDRWPVGEASVGFVEITLAYARNQYHVGGIDGGDERDVGFHRLQLAVGPGRAWPAARITVQGVLGYGGIYDGTELLERRDRTYAMPSVGLAIQGSRRIVTLAGRQLGIMARAAAVYHVADATDDDHWHGLAPSLTAGLALE
jgi:hypothetical protein